MGTINTKGIVLMENNLGDYDKMITILTPGLGKIRCAAKGARRTVLLSQHPREVGRPDTVPAR